MRPDLPAIKVTLSRPIEDKTGNQAIARRAFGADVNMCLRVQDHTDAVRSFAIVNALITTMMKIFFHCELLSYDDITR